jgi:cytoskeleton protein RodZ
LRAKMTLGQFMQGARESAGLSIDELASRVSIRAGLLVEMEKNNFVHCGGDTYARGHLRNIASHIFVDAQTLIDLYNEEHSSESRKIHDMLVENNVARIPTERKSIKPKSLVIASVALLSAIAVGQIIISNSETTVAPVVATTPSASPTASPSSSVAPSVAATEPATTESVPAAVNGEMKLTISAARGNSNIHVVTNGQTLFKGPIFQGDTKTFSAPSSLSIYLGNAGDLDLTLNGEKLAPLGARNEEIRKTFRSK